MLSKECEVFFIYIYTVHTYQCIYKDIKEYINVKYIIVLF